MARYSVNNYTVDVPVSYTHLDVYKRQDHACGHVLRAKGFVQDENGWVKLNATADGLTANAIPKGCLLYTSRCV